MHTPLCGHAVGEPVEYVRSAAELGLDLITFTCHVPMSQESFGGPRIRMHKDLLNEYYGKVAQARKAGELLGVEVLCGIEGEVFPVASELDEMKELILSQPFDFVLGSLHHQLKAYKHWIIDQQLETDEAIIRDYFRHLTDAARSGFYHSMSHPDVIRIYGTIDSDSFVPENFESEIRGLLKACIEEGTCLEVNTSGLSKGVFEVHPDPIILDWAHEEGVKLTIGSDAHAPTRVGQHFDKVLPLLKSKGFKSLHYFKNGCEKTVTL
ncbi:MAG: histidinol-phosphatase [Verrucomicrobia bacterium]|nr:histidinol-phosphatase [Verrucomicrobiota bacterium]